ncbi:MAG: hypothetical protein ACRBM6_00335 [Geminicoccales bacterium]
MVRWVIASLLASVLLTTTASSASLVSEFAGPWSGQTIEKPYDTVEAEMIGIEIEERDDGFELSWNDLSPNGEEALSGQPLIAYFAKTDRDGVFEAQPEDGSFLDQMFASPETGNPLDGENLLWARIDSETLSVYSLKIDENGQFDLDHYSWVRTDGGLALHYRQQTEALGDEMSIKGLLVRAGG